MSLLLDTLRDTHDVVAHVVALSDVPLDGDEALVVGEGTGALLVWAATGRQEDGDRRFVDIALTSGESLPMHPAQIHLVPDDVDTQPRTADVSTDGQARIRWPAGDAVDRWWLVIERLAPESSVVAGFPVPHPREIGTAASLASVDLETQFEELVGDDAEEEPGWATILAREIAEADLGVWQREMLLARCQGQAYVAPARDDEESFDEAWLQLLHTAVHGTDPDHRRWALSSASRLARTSLRSRVSAAGAIQRHGERRFVDEVVEACERIAGQADRAEDGQTAGLGKLAARERDRLRPDQPPTRFAGFNTVDGADHIQVSARRSTPVGGTELDDVAYIGARRGRVTLDQCLLVPLAATADDPSGDVPVTFYTGHVSVPPEWSTSLRAIGTVHLGVRLADLPNAFVPCLARSVALADDRTRTTWSTLATRRSTPPALSAVIERVLTAAGQIAPNSNGGVDGILAVASELDEPIGDR